MNYCFDSWVINGNLNLRRKLNTMPITCFDLHKIMVRAYQDSNVTAVLMEMIYDYFNNTSGIIKIKYDDNNKFIEISTGDCQSAKVLNDLRTIYCSFVISVIRNKELEYMLSFDSNYKTVKSMSNIQLSSIAAGSVTILDISIPNDTNKVFKINLVN